MLVVADNSPLNILIRVDQIAVLPRLFKRIVIPHQVADEMRHPHAPAPVRAFIANPPDWLLIEQPGMIENIPGLDAGECAAISLAVELHADVEKGTTWKRGRSGSVSTLIPTWR